MDERKLAPLRMDEWAAIQKRAKMLWEKTSLGVRPTFDEIKKTLPNAHSISILEWLAMVVLIVLTAFTSYKVGALAVPFAAKTLAVLADHTEISDPVKTSFTLVTALLFMLLATPSVIYFKLLAHEPEITAERKATEDIKGWRRFSLEWVTPRLPSVVVYFSIAWLVLISSALPGSVFEQYLPVVVEVALATLVGNILDKRTRFNKVVYDALKEKTDPYDQRLKNYETDTQYLKTLYQTMREGLMAIMRTDPATRRSHKVNAWIEEADEQIVYRLLSAEYRRLNSGAQFAADINAPAPMAQTPADTEPVPVGIGTKRVPPAGESVWTVDTLLHDLQVRGLNPAAGYSEMELLKDYAPKFGARDAWRGGAKKLFLG